MGMIKLNDSLHIRVKRLALETGKTIGQLVHDACEGAVESGEKALADLKKRTRSAKAKSTAKVQ